MTISPTQTTESHARVVLIDRYRLPRLGLVRLIEAIEGVKVVAHAATVADAIQLAQEYAPEIVIVDAELADEQSMTVVEALKAHGTRVLLLADDPTHSQIERALEAGADGFTLKDISIAELHSTLDRILGGDSVLHPDVASALARRFSPNGTGRSLTPRQREILALIAAGLENKQIARKLGIGVHTVKTHVSRVLQKLEASSRTEAVVVAMKERLIT